MLACGDMLRCLEREPVPFWNLSLLCYDSVTWRARSGQYLPSMLPRLVVQALTILTDPCPSLLAVSALALTSRLVALFKPLATFMCCWSDGSAGDLVE